MPTNPPLRQGAFISYARADGEAAARALHQRLCVDAPDVPSWLDRLEIEGGVGWWSQIEQELDRAEFLIIVMTPAALLSVNTRREWRAARQRGVCVYPVKGVADASLDYSSLPNWMQKAHFYEPNIEWQKLIAHLRRGCRATRVPFMAPALSASVIERPRETRALLQALVLDETASRLTALRGAGGYGKTTLAAALCHEDAVIEHFDDGILWVTLGQTPNLLNELIKLYAALTGERPGFVDAEDAARELSLKLESKNCLIVIDDVWKTAHALPFMRGGSGCARLITTRLGDVVPEARRVPVEQMSPDEALGLLLARLGTTPADTRGFQALVTRLGAWPLPIKLAGSLMRQRVERGDSQANALAYVLRALDKRGIVAFDERDSSERSGAVARTIEASLGLLSAPERERCTELAVFPEDTAIPMAVAAALWQLDDIDSEDLARRLDDLALIEFDLRHGTLQLHDVMRGFFAAQLINPAAVHARLLDAWGDPQHLPHAYAWRAWAGHMRGAGRQAELGLLLFNIGWLEAKLLATDVHAVIGDIDCADASPALALLGHALKLSAPALAAEPGQLRTQLVGRLLAIDTPQITAFVHSLQAPASASWLRPLQATLDAPGGLLLMTLVGHQHAVTALAADAEHRRLVSGSNDATLRLWNLEDGKALAEVGGFRLGVRGVAVFAQASLALVGSADSRVTLVDLNTHERVGRLSVTDRSAITAVAVSADGSVGGGVDGFVGGFVSGFVGVCAARDGSVRVWDIATRSLRHTIHAHKERVSSVAISADARRAVSGSEDGTLRVWRLDTAACEHTLAGHTDAVNSVAISPDGRLALSASSDRTIMLWDCEQGVRLKTLTGHTASVTALALAADAGRAVSGSSDGSARVWDLATGQTLAVLSGHSDAINAVVVNAAGTRAATGSADASIKLWRLDALAGAAPAEAHAGAAVCLVLSRDGSLYASGGSDGRIIVRQAASGEVVCSMQAHQGPVLSLALTEDGSCVLSGGVDGRYILWAIATGEEFVLPVRHLAPLAHSAYSAVARYLVTACRDHFVYLWDVPGAALLARYGTRRLFDHLITPAPRRNELPATEELLDTYLPGETVFDVAIVRMTDDGRYALLSATARDAGTWRGASTAAPPGSGLLVFELATGALRSLNDLQPETISAFAIDAAGERLLWARSDHRIELWSLDRGECIATLEGHTDKVNAVAFGAHDDRAVSCGRDRTLRVWALSTHETLACFTADAALRAVAVAPDGRCLFASDVAGRVHALRLEEPAAAPPLSAL
jgi:WD40 repeat protein